MPWLMHLCHLTPEYVDERITVWDLLSALDFIDDRIKKGAA